MRIGVEMVHQETEGLLSPLIRDIRLKQVAAHITEGSVVLDLACGAGYLSDFLPSTCSYYGVDRVFDKQSDKFKEFINLDLLASDSFSKLQDWLPEIPDYITCVAFVEHMDNPASFITQYSKLLENKGTIIGTTPHPCGKLIHESLSKLYLCSRHGAEEHEQFLGKKEIQKLATESDGNLKIYERFLFGLNQIFSIEYD